MRLFVSVDLPDDLASAVATLQSEFEAAEGLRFVDPEQAHVTLKFLGEVDEKRVSTVISGLEEAVRTAAIDPFEVTLSGLGVFPDLDYIRVLWLGITDGAERLTALHRATERAMVDRDFDPEEHEFTPHVTLARMDHAGGKALVQDRVQTLEPTVGTMRVEDIRLTESTRTPSGPEYTTVERIPLT